MKEQVQNLIKNAIQENAVKFKEQAAAVLYSKVGNRLKNEYINVSKSLFKNINESEASGPESMTFSADEMMAAPPSRGTGGSGTGPSGKPKKPYKGNPSRGPNPGPWNGGRAPKRSDIPTKGPDGDNEFRKLAQDWYDRFTKWWKQNEAYQPGPDKPPPSFIDIFGFEQGGE